MPQQRREIVAAVGGAAVESDPTTDERWLADSFRGNLDEGKDLRARGAFMQHLPFLSFRAFSVEREQLTYSVAHHII